MQKNNEFNGGWRADQGASAPFLIFSQESKKSEWRRHLFWYDRRMGEGRDRNRQSPANSGSSGLISVDFQFRI
jgi:hypothetical protein